MPDLNYGVFEITDPKYPNFDTTFVLQTESIYNLALTPSALIHQLSRMYCKTRLFPLHFSYFEKT